MDLREVVGLQRVREQTACDVDLYLPGKINGLSHHALHPLPHSRAKLFRRKFRRAGVGIDGCLERSQVSVVNTSLLKFFGQGIEVALHDRIGDLLSVAMAKHKGRVVTERRVAAKDRVGKHCWRVNLGRFVLQVRVRHIVSQLSLQFEDEVQQTRADLCQDLDYLRELNLSPRSFYPVSITQRLTQR